MTIFDREPAAIAGVVQAAIALVTAFGFNFTGEQVAAINAFSAVLLALITRSKVSPIPPKPKEEDMP